LPFHGFYGEPISIDKKKYKEQLVINWNLTTASLKYPLSYLIWGGIFFGEIRKTKLERLL